MESVCTDVAGASQLAGTRSSGSVGTGFCVTTIVGIGVSVVGSVGTSLGFCEVASGSVLVGSRSIGHIRRDRC